MKALVHSKEFSSKDGVEPTLASPLAEIEVPDGMFIAVVALTPKEQLRDEYFTIEQHSMVRIGAPNHPFDPKEVRKHIAPEGYGRNNPFFLLVAPFSFLVSIEPMKEEYIAREVKPSFTTLKEALDAEPFYSIWYVDDD